jgi:hypothetical protein
MMTLLRSKHVGVIKEHLVFSGLHVALTSTNSGVCSYFNAFVD